MDPRQESIDNVRQVAAYLAAAPALSERDLRIKSVLSFAVRMVDRAEVVRMNIRYLWPTMTARNHASTKSIAFVATETDFRLELWDGKDITFEAPPAPVETKIFTVDESPIWSMAVLYGEGWLKY